MMKQLSVVIVVYNQSCRQSLTCQQLQKIPHTDMQILIFDNSTRDYGNRIYCEENGWIYLGGTGNLGLSKAYNTCIDYLKETNFHGYVCLFDDDTELTADYFNALQKAMETGRKIFVPFVYSNGRILSPCRITSYHKTILFPSEQAAAAYQGTDITAINSGMALSFSIFDDYRYDENIFLDGIDHTHLRHMAAKNIVVSILDVRFHHHFSGDEKPSKKSALIRFGIFAKDYAYIFRAKKPAYWYLVGKRALRLTLQYKSLDFLKILLRSK